LKTCILKEKGLFKDLFLFSRYIKGECRLVELIVNALQREKRYALLHDGVLSRLQLSPVTNSTLVGNIFYGKVVSIEKGLNAAFVDIGIGKNGYLHRDQLPSYLLSPLDESTKKEKLIHHWVREGEKIVVQVKKDGTELKGPFLTGLIEWGGQYLIYLPFARRIHLSKKITDEQTRYQLESFVRKLLKDDEGVIIRTQCANATTNEIEQELITLRTAFSNMISRLSSLKPPALLYEHDEWLTQLKNEILTGEGGTILVDEFSLYQQIKTWLKQTPKWSIYRYQGNENIFSAYQVEGQLDKLRQPKVWLPNGSFIVIEQTEAMTVIDVNTGKFTGKNSLEDTVVETNRLAAVEIARQLRLRDISGIIIVDFIDMKSDVDRNIVLTALQNEIKQDTKRVHVIGFTELGLLQLTRKKTRNSWLTETTVTCPICDGRGRVVSAESLAFRLERELWELKNGEYEAVIVELTPDVKQFFIGEKGEHHKQLEETLFVRIHMKEINNAYPFYRISFVGQQRDAERILST
jgi:ribonuclease G